MDQDMQGGEGFIPDPEQGAVQELAAKINDMQLQQDIGQLVGEFPELSEYETAQRIAGQGGVAEQLAQQVGDPRLASNPAFWRMAHVLDQAEQQRQAAQPRTYDADSIVNAGDGMGRRSLPF